MTGMTGTYQLWRYLPWCITAVGNIVKHAKFVFSALSPSLQHPWTILEALDVLILTPCPYVGPLLVSNSPSAAHCWKSQRIYLSCITFIQPLTPQEQLTQERHALFPVGRCISNPHITPIFLFTCNINNSVTFALQI